ncbi:MAG TPA: NADH dehydrogenase subunit, partial [Pseudobdellovibrionaceae bacterium]|nr:NADH dehydrogenase subunit [Pseudobdellovibrionaceae bacterium]
IVSTFVNEFKSKNIFHWINNPESFENFDGLLIRGDKNPNTKGLLRVLEKFGVTASWSDLEKGLSEGKFSKVFVAGPENQAVFPDMKEKIQLLAKAKDLIWMQAGKNEMLESLPGQVSLIPLKTFVEKEGTFINQNGLERRFKKATTVVAGALTLTEVALLLSGKQLVLPLTSPLLVDASRPSDRVVKEATKKNEFVFRRGSL